MWWSRARETGVRQAGMQINLFEGDDPLLCCDYIIVARMSWMLIRRDPPGPRTALTYSHPTHTYAHTLVAGNKYPKSGHPSSLNCEPSRNLSRRAVCSNCGRRGNALWIKAWVPKRLHNETTLWNQKIKFGYHYRAVWVLCHHNLIMWRFRA